MIAEKSQLPAFPPELRTMIALAPSQIRSCKTTKVRCKTTRPIFKDQFSQNLVRDIVTQIAPAFPPTPDVEQQLYILAHDIALHYAETFHWSSFHAWNAVDQAKSVWRTIDTETFWDNLKPFGSCLGVSTHIYHDLVAAISKHNNPGVSKHADTVKLMTCAQHATSEIGYHAIVALCFNTYAIVIDHSIHPTAFKVSLGSEFVTHSYIPLFSDIGQERFKYFVKDGKYTLTMDSAIIDYPALSFTPMDVALTVPQLAIPAASQVKLLNGTQDVYLPPRKYVSVRTLLTEEPKHIPSVPLHGKFLATALRVQVSFEDAALLMQIPRADWLDKENGKSWACKVSSFDGCVEKCEATVHVSVKLSARTNSSRTEHEQSQVSMLGELAEKFGLGGKVIQEMADAILRVWAPYRGAEIVGQS
jgi:hypothetical protein